MAYDYVQAFTEGHSYNKIVAQYLRDNGVPCVVPELRIAKNARERREMTLTEKDIVLDLIPEILEVKSARRSFPWEPDNYPFRDAIVDTVSSYEEKEKEPLAYVFYSRPTGAMLAVGPSSKSRWKKVELFDKYQQIHDVFYVVDKSDLKSMNELVRHIIRRQESYKSIR